MAALNWIAAAVPGIPRRPIHEVSAFDEIDLRAKTTEPFPAYAGNDNLESS